MNVNVVTENNYFFLGIKASFHGGEQGVKKITPDELKSIAKDKCSEDDIFIFNMPSFIDELSFLIATDPFPGKLISIPIGRNVRLKVTLKKHIALDAHADVDIILHEITKSKGDEFATINSTQDKLTKREKAILLYNINGMDINAISQLLNISIKTVYAHRHNALHKLGGRNFFDIWPMKEEG